MGRTRPDPTIGESPVPALAANHCEQHYLITVAARLATEPTDD